MNFDVTPVTSEYRQYPLISKSKETTLSLTFPSIDQSEGLRKGRLIPDICHFFTRAKFLENIIYTKKTRKL